MDIKVKDGKLIISIIQIIECLSLEDKQQIIDTLSCEDDIIKNVTDQLLTGFTEMGSHGSTGSQSSTDPTPLDKARMEIALRSGEVAEKEIKSMKDTLKWEKACCDSYRDWGFKMYHGREPLPVPSINYDETLQYDVIRREV